MFEFEFYPDQKVAEYKLKLIIIQMRLSQQVILNKEIVLTSVTWYDAVLCGLLSFIQLGTSECLATCLNTARDIHNSFFCHSRRCKY